MNKRLRNSILTGAAVATLGFGGLGLAGVASAASATARTSLIDKLASKFNVNRDEVAAVFAADRTEHQAQRQAAEAQRLAQAVTAGKLTQVQADHIAQARKDIEALMVQSDPGESDEATRTAIKTKLDALRTWAQEQTIDLSYVGPGGHGLEDHGAPGSAMAQPSDATSTN